MVGLSVREKEFIKGGIAQDLCSDGQKRYTYRPIYVETGVIPQANGSARVRLGVTDVIASVKAELGKQSALQPDKGKVSIFIDCSPTAESTFEVVHFGSSSFQVYYFADSGPLHGCGFFGDFKDLWH